MGREARAFSSSTTYASGDLALYNGTLYRFISSHTGAWDPDDVEPEDQSTEQILTRILSAKDNAERATTFMGTIVFGVTQIVNTRYKCVLTNAPDPR